MPADANERESDFAAGLLMRRLGRDDTRELLTLLELPQAQRQHAIEEESDGDARQATIAEIADRLHRDEPMLTQFARALRRALGR